MDVLPKCIHYHKGVRKDVFTLFLSRFCVRGRFDSADSLTLKKKNVNKSKDFQKLAEEKCVSFVCIDAMVSTLQRRYAD